MLKLFVTNKGTSVRKATTKSLRNMNSSYVKSSPLWKRKSKILE